MTEGKVEGLWRLSVVTVDLWPYSAGDIELTDADIQRRLLRVTLTANPSDALRLILGASPRLRTFEVVDQQRQASFAAAI